MTAIGAAGVGLKYFVTPAFAVGVNGRYFPKTVEAGGLKLVMASLPITAKLDYFLLPGGIRPYVGVEGGLYLSRAKVTYNGTSQTDSESHAGVAPKAGLLVGFGQGLALHLAGGYHLTFVDSEIGKTLLLEAGVALQMGDL